MAPASRQQNIVHNRIVPRYEFVDEEKRFGEEQRQARKLQKEKEEAQRNRLLFHSKLEPFQELLIASKPQFAQNCMCCYSRDEVDSHEWRRDDLDVLKLSEQNKNNQLQKYFQGIFNGIIVRPGQLSWVTQKIQQNKKIIFLLRSASDFRKTMLKFVLSKFDVIPVDLGWDDVVPADLQGILEKLNCNKHFLVGFGDADQLIAVLLDSKGDFEDVELALVSLAFDRFFEPPEMKAHYWIPKSPQNGFARVNFHQPYNWKNLVETIREKSDCQDFYDDLIRHIQMDLKCGAIVTPAGALAFLLLYRFREGATIEVLSEALSQLTREIENKMDLSFDKKSPGIVCYAAHMLGPKLIAMEEREDLFLKPLDFLELYHYAKQILPLYAGRGIVATVAKQLLRDDGKIELDKLIQGAVALNDIIYFECLARKPCESFQAFANDALFQLCQEEVLSKPENEVTEEEVRARNIARHLDMDDSEDEDDDNIYVVPDEVTVIQENKGRLDFYAGILRPIVEAYYGVFECLFKLAIQPAMLEDEFVRLALENLEAKVESGFLKCKEAVNEGFVHECIKTLEYQKLISVRWDRGVRLIQHNMYYQPYENTLRYTNHLSKIYKEFAIDVETLEKFL
jgi:hypothetical protein